MTNVQKTKRDLYLEHLSLRDRLQILNEEFRRLRKENPGLYLPRLCTEYEKSEYKFVLEHGVPGLERWATEIIDRYRVGTLTAETFPNINDAKYWSNDSKLPCRDFYKIHLDSKFQST